MIDADEPMMTERWTEAETLAVLNGATLETPANFLAYSENFFAHGFQNVRKNSEEMQRILSNLENSAKVGNELAGAVLGKAVLATFTRRQVIEDALSFLTRAVAKGIRGAAVELCYFYFDRINYDDLDDFEDADVGVDDCYPATKEYPRIFFPSSVEECAHRVVAAAISATFQGDFDAILHALTIVLADFGGEKRFVGRLDATLLKRAKEHVTQGMAAFAAYRAVEEGNYPNPLWAINILEYGAEQGEAYSLGFLGQMYLTGRMKQVKPDANKAFDYFTRSVAAGNNLAKPSLAQCYREGIGAEPDEKKAVALMLEAADENVPEAMVEVGCNLVEAGLEKGDNKAVKDGCNYIRCAAEDENYPEAWKAILEFHERRVGPFKTNKFARAARAALKELEYGEEHAGL